MLTTTMLTILTDARALVATPEQWCRDTLARDATGRDIGAMSLDAVKFCMMGALIHALAWRDNSPGVEDKMQIVHNYLACFAEDGVKSGVAAFNDRSAEHEDVLKVFDLAIEYAKAKNHPDADHLAYYARRDPSIPRVYGEKRRKRDEFRNKIVKRHEAGYSHLEPVMVTAEGWTYVPAVIKVDISILETTDAASSDGEGAVQDCAKPASKPAALDRAPPLGFLQKILADCGLRPTPLPHVPLREDARHPDEEALV